MKLNNKNKRKKEFYLFFIFMVLMLSRSNTLKLEKILSNQNNTIKLNNQTQASYNYTDNKLFENIQFFDRKSDNNYSNKVVSNGYLINDNNEIVINTNLLNNEELNIIKK